MVATVAVFVAAAVLLWAGLEKVRASGGFDATLVALGVTSPVRPLLRVGVPVAEVVTGACLMVAPAAGWPRGMLVVLAVGFAGAGVLGLRAEEPVVCSCFGTVGRHVLGWRQLLTLPVWLLAAAILERRHPGWPPSEGLRNLAALVVLLGVLRVPAVVRGWQAARGDRLALMEGIDEGTPIFLAGQREVVQP